LAETHRHLEEVSAQLRQRDAALESASTDRKRLAAQVAKLSSQLRADQDALESVRGRSALERTALEAERDRLKEQAAAADAEIERLERSLEDLSRAAAEIEASRAAAAAECAALRQSVEDEGVKHRRVEDGLQSDLAAAQSDARRLGGEATRLRSELAMRDEQLGQLQEEQAAARQAQSDWEQRSGALGAELAAVRTQLEASAAECEQLRAARAAAERQLGLVVAERSAAEQARAQGLEAVRAQVAELEQERARQEAAVRAARQQVLTAQAQRQAELEAAQADAARWREQAQALESARTALGERLERAEQALAAQHEQVAGEGRRAQELAAQCAQLQQALAAVTVQRAGREQELTQVRAELEALRAQSADRGVLAEQAAELGRKVVELEQGLAAARGEAARAERQRTAVAEELEAVRRQQAQAAAQAEQEQRALQEAVQRLSEERGRLEAAQAAQQRETQAQAAALEAARATLDQAQGERVALERAGQDVAQRLAETHRHLEELSAQLRQRDAALESAAAERKRVDEALRIAESVNEELTAARDEMRRKAEAVADRLEKERLSRIQEVMALQQEVVRLENQQQAGRARQAQARRSEERIDVDYDAPLVIERSAPLDTALATDGEPPESDSTAEPAPESAESAQPVQELVLLDGGARADEACTTLEGAGFQVSRAAPNDVTVDELARRTVSCAMLNLAAGPSAWRTLRVLRERVGTRDMPILAYVMQPDAPKGFSFGRADFGLWPMEPERMVERLGHLRPKLKRLLAVSADVDGINRLREPLARAGISTSIVLDGKQVVDVAAMVQPDAVVVHLSPDCPAVGRALAGLRAHDATRNLPLLVLLDKAPAREEMFYASTVRELSLKATFQLTGLPSEIARLLA
jgi:chromosome segregation ATPase